MGHRDEGAAPVRVLPIIFVVTRREKRPFLPFPDGWGFGGFIHTQKGKETAKPSLFPPGCRKSRWLFSTACNNAGIFVPRSGTKILASLHARLAEQGLARHLIRFEAGFAPSSSPCEEERLHARQGFIDKQRGKETALPSLFPLFQSRSNGGGSRTPLPGCTEGRNDV